MRRRRAAVRRSGDGDACEGWEIVRGKIASASGERRRVRGRTRRGSRARDACERAHTREARGVARGWWNGSEVVEARDWVTDEGDAFFDWDSDRTRRSVA